MKQVINLLLLISLCVGLFSCVDQKEKTGTAKQEILNYSAKEIIENNTTPTVNIEKYTLIQARDENREKDAEEILNLKRRWPLVMQSPSRAGFDSILSKNFIFTGEGHLLNREDYITDRTTVTDWKISYVKYNNLTLQFFGNTALLTYRNEVTNENVTTKEIEIEYISWADIYVMESNKWKIDSAHVVDFRIENACPER